VPPRPDAYSRLRKERTSIMCRVSETIECAL
jgi:hypothetical protein